MASIILVVGALTFTICVFYIGSYFYKAVLVRRKTHKNPYIAEHLAILENDRAYDEYLAYLDKNNIEGIPLEKKLTVEEYQMKKELGLIK